MSRELLTSCLPDEQCPDTYFSRGYGEASAITRGGRWHCLRWHHEIALPYVVNAVSGTLFDAASPYGYSGIHVAPGCGVDDLTWFWKQAKQEWHDRGIVAMFFRFSPLDMASLQAVAELDDVVLTRRGDTVAVPVGQSPEALWGNLKSSCRYMVRKALKAAMTARIRPARARDLQAGAPFRKLYERTMKRVGSAEAYLFGDDYYVALARGLGDGLAIAEVENVDGCVVAAALVFLHRDRVHYHLAGSDSAAAPGASNLLLWTILSWAANHGYQWVHLGGGVRPDDSLFWFKESFGGYRKQFWTGATVLNPSAYRRLVREHAADTGITPQQLADSGFFPAYRFGKGLV